MSRADLRQQVEQESRRHYAAYVLFNQAMADRLGLHATDVQVLSLLSLEDEPCPVGVIARLTGLTTGSATRVVDRLERAGHVRRVSDPRDGRRVLVERTSSRADEAWQAPGKAFAQATSRYTSDELGVIRDYLERIGDVGRQQTQRLRDLTR